LNFTISPSIVTFSPRHSRRISSVASRRPATGFGLPYPGSVSK
jgi:hypothetical protein